MSSAVTSDPASSYFAEQAWGAFAEVKGGLTLAQGRRGEDALFWQGSSLGNSIPGLHSPCMSSREIETINERSKCEGLDLMSTTNSLVRWVTFLQVILLLGLFCR